MATLIQFLSAKSLAAALAKADAVRSEVCDELIAAGRGHETHSETSRKVDPLSLRYIAASDAYRELSDERRKRHQWHGTMKPIRQTKAL